jgi:hypothetical protein
LAESSKHILQIAQLLEEKSLAFSFCLNKNNVITLCALSLLYQDLDIVQESSLMKDGQRLVGIALDLLEKMNAPGASDFRILAASLVTSDGTSSPSHRSADGHMRAASTSNSTPSPFSMPKQAAHQTPYSMACSSEANVLPQDRSQKVTFSEPTYNHANVNRNAIYPVWSETSKPCISLASQIPTSQMGFNPSLVSNNVSNNVDFSPNDNNGMAFHQRFSAPMPTSGPHERPPIHTVNGLQHPIVPTTLIPTPNIPSSVTMAEWDFLLSTIDGGESNIYDAVYGGWSANGWDMTALNMHNFNVGGPAPNVLGDSRDAFGLGKPSVGKSESMDDICGNGALLLAGNNGCVFNRLDSNFGS